ncbi:MAG TPA: sensor histidine kinase [Ruminiclostridium sp.]|nr:sensor histidine kinase [Ruminiclostridium sp.]
MKKIIRWFFDAKLSAKIIMYYITIFILFTILCFLTFERLSSNMTNREVKQISTDNVNTIGSNLDLIISTVNSQSQMLISSSTLQSVLRKEGLSEYDDNQKQLDSYLSEFTNYSDAISSIYIFDKSGKEYFVDNLYYKNVTLQKIKSQAWYSELEKKAGGYILKLNGGGSFDAGNRNFVSLIRNINDLNTQKTIGVMVVNITEDYINSSFGRSFSSSGMRIMLSDENNRQIFHSGNVDESEFNEITKNTNSEGLSQFKEINGKQCVISSVKNGYNWTIAAITPIDELAASTRTFNVFIIVFAIIIFAMFIVAITFTSLSVTRPINKLAKAMNSMKNGNFTEVHISNAGDEIGMLQDVYNRMVKEIQTLFNDMTAEQKAKRKAELEALQIQIKPHFLYNSFDAISSLALSGENSEVYKAVRALGKFYRAFLNSGSEVVTVGQELEMIRQYLTIQLIRFKDKFTVEWDIDDNVMPMMIPRLTLQPLVENAIKHGIKENPQKGLLTISAGINDGNLELIIRDNGQGMDKQELEKLLAGESGGAGLKITRERLKLYFDSPVFALNSEKGFGCEAKIIVPAVREAKNIE